MNHPLSEKKEEHMKKSIRELPLIEQLAIEQAFFSRLGEDVSTKNPDSLRTVADE